MLFKRPAYGFLLLAAVAVAVTVLLYACQNNADNVSSAGGIRRTTAAIGLGDLRPPDDPANPYRDQYEDIDQWVYANQSFVSEGLCGKVDFPEGGCFMPTVVDTDGFIWPCRKTARRQAEMYASGADWSEGLLLLYSVGIMEPELLQAGWEIGYDEKADFYMPVPQWLVDAPPRRAILLPTGDVVAYGELGWDPDQPVPEDESPGCCGGAQSDCDGYYWYSAAGELLAVTKENWYEMFRNIEVEFRRELVFFKGRPDGYNYFHDNHGNIRIFSYEGTEYTGEGEPPLRDSRHFATLTARQIKLLHAAQQRQGII